MADFKTHISTSCVLGGGYAAVGAYYGLPIEAALVAGGLCGVSGMLPDIDSDSGVPLRETMGLAAALTPMLLIDRFQQLGLNYEQMVLAAGASYLFVRFGLAQVLMRCSVHRGMFHSIPAILIFTGLAFLFFCGSANLHLRYFKAGGVFLGVFSHLLVDEIYSIEWTGGRWRFKSSFGTALKLWGDSAWGNFSTYGKLAAIVVLILSEPAVMNRYGVLSPIIVDNAAIRERLNLPPSGGSSTKSVLAQGAAFPSTEWSAIPGAYPTIPTEGAAPPAGQPDRTIYDTARRIWQRIAH
jgi:membrane-bound metal-dependent hydrolase YbcI (DUF457 family)